MLFIIVKEIRKARHNRIAFPADPPPSPTRASPPPDRPRDQMHLSSPRFAARRFRSSNPLPNQEMRHRTAFGSSIHSHQIAPLLFIPRETWRLLGLCHFV